MLTFPSKLLEFELNQSIEWRKTLLTWIIFHLWCSIHWTGTCPALIISRAFSCDYHGLPPSQIGFFTSSRRPPPTPGPNFPTHAYPKSSRYDHTIKKAYYLNIFTVIPSWTYGWLKIYNRKFKILFYFINKY